MSKNVLIGITGSIAAYKTAELIRFFKKNGCEVKVTATASAFHFIGEKTLETLSNNPVYFDTFQKRMQTEHISLADWADIFVLAPASANTISKIALGLCDNLLTSVVCAYLGKNKPLFIAPAMNEGMWNNPCFKSNIEILKKNNVRIIEPIEGNLACGTVGTGKMEEPEKIFKIVNEFLNPRTACKKVVVTAGGTREYIDPVRFISNASSGKTGICLADCAYNMGFDTVLISAVEVEKQYKVINVSSAAQMQTEVLREFETADYLFMAAAVSDFKIKNYTNKKISKNEIKNGSYNLELSLNPDILKNAGRVKKQNQKIIGFCLATENPVEPAIKKIKEKHCDFIIANEAKTALNSDTNQVWVIDKNCNIQEIEKAPKAEIARKILEIVL